MISFLQIKEIGQQTFDDHLGPRTSSKFVQIAPFSFFASSYVHVDAKALDGH